MRPIALGMVLSFFFVCTAWAGPTPGIIPEMRECMPGKYSATIARESPTASKFSPPR